MSFYKKTFSYKTASTEDKKRENIYELKFHERNYAEYIIIFKLFGVSIYGKNVGLKIPSGYRNIGGRVVCGVQFLETLCTSRLIVQTWAEYVTRCLEQCKLSYRSWQYATVNDLLDLEGVTSELSQKLIDPWGPACSISDWWPMGAT